MGFILPSNIILNNISQQNNVILTAQYPTYVQKINVCNLSDNNTGIRIFLKQVKSLDVLVPIEAFIISELLITKNVTLNLIQFLGSEIFLPDGESLIIFSGGYTQNFDCVTDYYEIIDPTIN